MSLGERFVLLTKCSSSHPLFSPPKAVGLRGGGGAELGGVEQCQVFCHGNPALPTSPVVRPRPVHAVKT